MNLLNERLTGIRRRKVIFKYQIKEETNRKRLMELIEKKHELEKEETDILRHLGVLHDENG